MDYLFLSFNRSKLFVTIICIILYFFSVQVYASTSQVANYSGFNITFDEEKNGELLKPYEFTIKANTTCKGTFTWNGDGAISIDYISDSNEITKYYFSNGMECEFVLKNQGKYKFPIKNKKNDSIPFNIKGTLSLVSPTNEQKGLYKFDYQISNANRRGVSHIS